MTSHPEGIQQARASFMRRASAPHVSPFALKLAYLIAFKHMDSKTPTARPSQMRRWRAISISRRTLFGRLLDILQPLGLVIVPGSGRRPRRHLLRSIPTRRRLKANFAKSCVDGSRVARDL